MAPRDLLESDALRAFAVFAEHENFTAAAARLRISQPALHAKISRLGASLGVDLYERRGRGLVLTAAGRRLAALAHDAARQVDDFLADLHATDGPVTVAAGRGAVRWVVPDGLRRLATSGRAVRLLVAGRGPALDAVTSGGADLCVVAHDPPPPELRHRVIARFPQVLVVPRRHRLGRRETARLTDLEGLALVVPPQGRPHRAAIDRALLDAGVSWSVGAEVDGWDLLVHLASLGLGATVVNGCVKPPTGFVAVPVTDLPPVRYWAAWRPARQAAVRDVVAALVPA